MRFVCGLALSAWLALSLVALVGGEASAGIVCGNFDGKFTCKSDSSAAKQFGIRANMAGEVDRFAAALAADAILPEDF